MVDETPAPTERERWTWTVALVVYGVAFCTVAIVLITGWGTSGNALHYFSLTGAWGMFLGILFGMGVVKGLEVIAPTIGRK